MSATAKSQANKKAEAEKMVTIAVEPIFTIRAQDKLAPIVVGLWIQMATLLNVRQEKIDQAKEVKAKIEAWQLQNVFKVPD